MDSEAKSLENEISPGQFDLKDEEVLSISLYRPSFFKILVDRYQEPFLRKAQSIIRRREDAEDIIQEAFTKIYIHAGKFKKIQGIEFKSWAYKIVMNTALTKYRKIKKENQIEFFEPMFYKELSTNEDLVFKTDNKTAVSYIISLMPETFGRLLSLYYLEDKPYKIIAHEENLTIPALKMKLFRAKKLFKKLFKQKYEN